jgi:hypothetical protein
MSATTWLSSLQLTLGESAPASKEAGARLELVVAEDGDAKVPARYPERLVGGGEIGPAAEGGDAVLLQQGERFQEGRLAVIARVVVGHGQGVEAALQHRHRSRLGAKAIHLVVEGTAGCGDGAFQVADGIVGVGQEGGEGGEGIAPGGDHSPRPIRQHHIAGEDQAHGLGPCGHRQEKQEGGGAAQDLHGAFPSGCRRHQYWSSPSRTGS